MIDLAAANELVELGASDSVLLGGILYGQQHWSIADCQGAECSSRRQRVLDVSVVRPPIPTKP
jgi:hypothetical protein